MIKLTKPLNILVKRRGAIGDVIMATGLVREIKRQHGDNANIYVATECIEVFKNNPHVAGTLYPDSIGPEQMSVFDVVYNLDDAYEVNRDIHYVDAYFYKVFGKLDKNKSVELFPSELDYVTVNELKQQHDLSKYIVVHMRNWHWQAKNISLEVWFDVFTKLFEERDDFKIVTIGGQTDLTVDHPLFVDLRAANLTSQQMKVLCDEADCFVGIDSGPFQCAAASKTPIIALLTHLYADRIVPDRKWFRGYHVKAIKTLEDCHGCNDRQALPVRQIVCEKTDYPCTRNFDTQAIADAILKVL
jgi:ADP-heptose:LPS heptosyltransferase